MATNLIKFVSPKFAIRAALGNLGYTRLMQTLEPDLIRWCMEAQNLISRKGGFKFYEYDTTVQENKIALCEGFMMLECMSVAGKTWTLNPDRSCVDSYTPNCLCLCTGYNHTFHIDDCYLHLHKDVDNDTPAHVIVLRRPYGDDGYPLVPDVCTIAIQEYVMWQICFRERDNRVAACEQRWYFLCRTARSELNKYTQAQLQELGLFWYTP